MHCTLLHLELLVALPEGEKPSDWGEVNVPERRM